MTKDEAQAYYNGLGAIEMIRFLIVVAVGIKIGKPIEDAYAYAKTIIESKEEGSS